MFKPVCGAYLKLRLLRSVTWLALLSVLAGCDEAGIQPQALPIAAMRVGDVLAGENDSSFRRADYARAFRFPADHGKHPAFRSEWWYLTAVLNDHAGNRYGLQFTIFRQALTATVLGDSPWQSGQAYLAHFAVTDQSRARHYADQRFARGHPEQADVRIEPRFMARVADWTLSEVEADVEVEAEDEVERDPGQWRIRAFSRGEVNHEGADFGVDVSFEMDSPPILQGDEGLSHKGPGQASYYYSMPRLATKGYIELDGQRIAVQGVAWMDREWSTSVLADGVVGWDWMALQMDDGRDLMAFRLRRKDGQRDPYDHGLLAAAADARKLSPRDFKLEPLDYWRDTTGSRWPIRWALTLATGERLLVEAVVEDQLMDLGLVYWEGLVRVRNAQQQNSGYGYLELTGYREFPALSEFEQGSDANGAN